MAVYKYIAKDRSGNRFSGTYNNIENIAVLRRELNKIGCSLVKARREKVTAVRHSKVSQAEIVTFVYEFAGMFAAGLAIPRCLRVLESKSESPGFRYVLSDICESVETGSTLKDAFEKHDKVFSGFLIGMLEAGESSGKLYEALEVSAKYLESQTDLRHRVRSAFTYPIVLAVVCLVVVTCLLIFIIPTFSKIYRQLHVPLPLPTQALVNLSSLVISWGWAIPLGVAAVILLARQCRKAPYIRAKWDILKLKMPIVGNLNRMIVVSRYIRTFAMLTSAGVPFLEALDIARQVANNAKMSEITTELQKAVESGQPIARAMENHDIFPPVIIQLATSGEEAGALPDMLNKGVDFLDKIIGRTINSLIVKLEPTLTVAIGVIIGFMLISVYLPLFDYVRHVR